MEVGGSGCSALPTALASLCILRLLGGKEFMWSFNIQRSWSFPHWVAGRACHRRPFHQVFCGSRGPSYAGGGAGLRRICERKWKRQIILYYLGLAPNLSTSGSFVFPYNSSFRNMKTVRIFVSLLSLFVPVLCFNGCSASRYTAFQVDNGPDYVRDGLYRIVDGHGRVGYADPRGRVVIKPRFAFGFPFEKGKARVTDSGAESVIFGSGGEYHRWEGDDWYYIDKSGNRIQ